MFTSIQICVQRPCLAHVLEMLGYTHAGGYGVIIIAMTLCFILLTIWWLRFWTRRGFRVQRARDAARVRLSAIVLVSFLMTIMACFPPWRQVGTWFATASGIELPEELSNRYDRAMWGYIPRYAWINTEREIHENYTYTSLNIEEPYFYRYGYFSPKETWWEIDWMILTVQYGVLLLYTFPFLLARNVEHPRPT